ncbi:XRE family transcriptional regulator [Streptomyces phaeochromogenes]|uniref:XRE family transcriptional regulator n=1 Tax=Streptomyces phaeochromogenes TaxID=1923 RepID=A0ABZ1HUJ2_STRPH|nr:XRE family transcriptional regulator [Streptomyces phaeochromogenes]WSD21242.1 XRE family transcriptional regulator [Streptomyces phaeochromogenes]
MDETTRHPLVVARCAAGMTMEEFVSAIHAAASRRNLRSGIDDARVRKWHRGVTPNDESQIYIAEALGWPADIVRANDWPNWLPLTADGVVPLGPHSSVPALREALRTAMDRRTFFTISGATLSALAADWAVGPTSALAQARDGKPIGDDFVTFLESTVEYLTGLATEQRQHAPALLDAHLSTVTELLERGRYTPALGLRLHTLAASLSQTVAWHSFDLGRHTTASQNWIAGLHNAHAAGDHDLGAGLLGDLAYQAAWRGDHTTAASILHHALTRAQNPAARCLLQLRLARTLAARGERSERRTVLRALAAAEKHLSDAGTDRPAWCAWVSEADLAVDSGQALLDLGDTGRAHQLIAEGESLLPPARDKTRGVFLTYRAASYLSLNDPEPAAAAATESLILARRIGAPRCANLVRDLLPRFQPYRHAQGVPELLQLAAA